MHILGLANGRINGNSEILLKAALTAAAAVDPSITVSWIHVPSVAVPLNPKPLRGTLDMGLGTMILSGSDSDSNVPDDRAAVLQAILDADALILATPVYSHQPAGTLKALTDRLLGPLADAAYAIRVAEGRKSGGPRYEGIQIDERLLKPKVAAFIAVSGSKLSDQVTMALPTLHMTVYGLHAKVVDQILVQGYGNHGAVLLDEDKTIGRAQKLGQNVVSQMGKPYDEALYLGPEQDGSCPYCHMSKLEIQYTKENDIGCITCGARGRLLVGADGTIRPVWEVDSNISSLTLLGKLNHLDDIGQHAAEEGPKMASIKDKVNHWTNNVHVPQVQLPSSVKHNV